jgi:hypothetical protein
MIPVWLKEPAEQVWAAALRGQGPNLYPWLENLLRESDAPECDWVPTLEIGSAIYNLHGRFAEGERLARRAVARSLDSPLYARALLCLSRAYLAQGRSQEAQECYSQVESIDDWSRAHQALLAGEALDGQPAELQNSWWQEPSLTALADPDPFPLWRGNLCHLTGSISPLPLFQPLVYPPSWDELASWPKTRGIERRPWLDLIKVWRASQLTGQWLGPISRSRFTYRLRLELTCPQRVPQWLSIELAGGGLQVLRSEERLADLAVIEDGQPVALPQPPNGPWFVIVRGSSRVVERGTKALVRVGFSQGPPLQVALQ